MHFIEMLNNFELSFGNKSYKKKFMFLLLFCFKIEILYNSKLQLKLIPINTIKYLRILSHLRYVVIIVNYLFCLGINSNLVLYTYSFNRRKVDENSSRQ